MKNYYLEKQIVKDTDLDFLKTVPITNLMRILQDTAFTHADKVGLSHAEMIAHSNAFWVITKMKMRLIKPLKQFDKFVVKTWMHPASGVRVERDFSITSNKQQLVEACAEWCCLDWQTRKLRKMSTIKYPTLSMKENSKSNLEYSNYREPMTEKDFCYSRVVHSTDIDLNKHTNNLRYNFFALDAFSSKEIESLNFKEYEIHFVSESKEGDEIKIYRRQVENKIVVEGLCKNKTVFRSIFTI